MKTWLICYDIFDNKRRYHIEKILLGFGERIQLSVFECTLSASQLTKLKNHLEQFVAESDLIHYYPLCTWCKDKRQAQGQASIVNYHAHYIV